jgi:hypothetical protein
MTESQFSTALAEEEDASSRLPVDGTKIAARGWNYTMFHFISIG